LMENDHEKEPEKRLRCLRVPDGGIATVDLLMREEGMILRVKFGASTEVFVNRENVIRDLVGANHHTSKFEMVMKYFDGGFLHCVGISSKTPILDRESTVRMDSSTEWGLIQSAVREGRLLSTDSTFREIDPSKPPVNTIALVVAKSGGSQANRRGVFLALIRVCNCGVLHIVQALSREAKEEGGGESDTEKRNPPLDVALDDCLKGYRIYTSDHLSTAVFGYLPTYWDGYSDLDFEDEDETKNDEDEDEDEEVEVELEEDVAGVAGVVGVDEHEDEDQSESEDGKEVAPPKRKKRKTAPACKRYNSSGVRSETHHPMVLRQMMILREMEDGTLTSDKLATMNVVDGMFDRVTFYQSYRAGSRVNPFSRGVSSSSSTVTSLGEFRATYSSSAIEYFMARYDETTAERTSEKQESEAPNALSAPTLPSELALNFDDADAEAFLQDIFDDDDDLFDLGMDAISGACVHKDEVDAHARVHVRVDDPQHQRTLYENAIRCAVFSDMDAVMEAAFAAVKYHIPVVSAPPDRSNAD